MVPVERDGEDWQVVDAATGERHVRSATSLERISEKLPLPLLAHSLPRATEPPLDSIHDERALGILVVLDAIGPVAVEALLRIDGLCESDLHGSVGELSAAGLVAETDVDGRRGYRITDAAEQSLDTLRDQPESR